MTKLASEIVGIMNSRNEYMEKQAGLSSFIARKVVKPVSRFLFGKTDLAAAKAKRYLQSKRIFDKLYKPVKVQAEYVNHFADEVAKMKNPYFRDPMLKIYDEASDKYGKMAEPFEKRLRELAKMRVYHPEGPIRDAELARKNFFRDVTNLGLLGLGSGGGAFVGRLTAPEPTLQDVINKYIDKIRK